MAVGTKDKTGSQILNIVCDVGNKALNVIATALGLASDATQGEPANDTTIQTSHEAKDFDGAALPNTVDEGDAVRPAATLSGVTYTTPVNEDGSKSPVNSSGYFDIEIQADNAGLALESGGNLDTISGDTTSIDGKTPALGTAAMAASSPVTIASDDTLTTAIKTAVELMDDAVATDDSDPGATPSILLAGGEYRSADSSYTDGDATILQTDVAGKLKIAGYDTTSDLNKTQDQSPLQAQYTSPVALVTASDIGAVDDTWKSQGEISTAGYKTLTLWINLTVNDSTGNQLQVLALPSSGGTQHVEEVSGEYQKTLGDSDITGIRYHYDLKHTTPYVLIQTKATTVGATEGTVTVNYTMGVL